MSDVELERIAARERAAMEAGATVREVLRRLREEDELGTIAQHVVLRTIKRISFGIAKQIVFDYRDLELDLDDLALLASVPKHCRQAWWLVSEIDWAIVRREPHHVIDPEHGDELLRALDDPAWRREIAIERDDADGLHIRFVRVKVSPR